MTQALFDREVVVAMVGRMQSHRAPHGLEVVAPAAAGAGIQQHARESLAQSIPVCEIAAGVTVLCHTFAFGRIIVAPVLKRIDVEVLPVHIDPLAFDQRGDTFSQPLQRLGVAEIEDTVLVLALEVGP